jgi:hypothetical protein
MLISGSLTATGTITAQTLVVQTITSSVDFVTGSTRFGSLSSNTMQITGSVSISGSSTALNVNSGSFFISSSGNVGIGTINPSTRLTISKPIDFTAYGSGSQAIDFKVYYPGYDVDTVKASIYVGVSNTGTLNTQGGYMGFMTSNNGTLAERVRIEKDGNVGINTSSPAVHGNAGYTTLTIVGGTTNRGWLELGTSTASSSGNIFGQISGFNGTNARAGEVRFFDDGAVNKAGIDFAILNTGEINVAMRITSLGNIGIGATSPAAKLHTCTAYGGNNIQAIFGNSNGSINSAIYDTVIIQADDVTTLKLVERNIGGVDQVLTMTVGDNFSRISTTCTNPLQFFVGGNPSACGYNGLSGINALSISSAGAACFSSTIQASGATIASDVVGDPVYLRVRNNNTGGYPSSLALSLYGYSGTAAYFDALRIQASYPGYGSANFYVKYQSNSADVLALTLRGDGYMFSVPTYNNTWPGSSANMYVASDGSFGRVTASSRRFKENIIDWSGNGLDTILALKPKTFKYKKDYVNSDLNFLGLIAEEVAEVLPYLAEYKNPDRTGLVENVRYDTIVVPLIAAIQEQQCTICSQASMINTLKTCLGII